MLYPSLPDLQKMPVTTQKQVPYTPLQPYALPYAFKNPYSLQETYDNKTLYQTLLMVFVIIFFFWDAALTFCNIQTIIGFFDLNDVTLTIAAIAFFVMIAIKVYSLIISILTLISPTSNGLQTFEEILIIGIIVNFPVVIYTIVLSVNSLLPGSLMGFLFDSLLFAGMSAFSALLWKEYHPSSLAPAFFIQPRIRY